MKVFRPELSLLATATILLLQGCSGGGDSAPPSALTPPPASAPQPASAPLAVALACDDSIKTAFKPDANTTVLLVKQFKKGDPLVISGTPAAPAPSLAPNDLCLVKLNVGPGNPGPASAPSTTAGIGIEVWLPSQANWNGRIHNIGSGGWAGGSHGSTTALDGGGLNSSVSNPSFPQGVVAGNENAVVGTTDTGHSQGNPSFLLNPDGTINSTGWKDFSERSLLELAVKTKALTAAYYGKAHKFAYFDGCSQGGRQASKMIQNHPGEYDGYLVGAPALDWTRSLAGTSTYPQVVTQNDLGGVPLTVAQQNLVNGAAISACDVVGGEHLGYLTDPLSCKYDPRKDAAVLCSGTTIGGVIGTNTTAACVNGAQATAMVKFWYGPTTDGSVPDPAVDNGTAPTLSGQRIAHGIARGTNTVPANFFGIGLDTLALALQDPTYGTADLKNPTGSGLNRWKSWDYGAFASAVNQSLTMQPFFADYDTNKTDLSAAKAAGVKIIHYHGLADSLISPMNSVNYYTAMQAKMGGYATTQSFNRMFLIPKQDHCNIDLGGVAGAAGPAVSMAQGNVPLPGGAALLDTSTGANRTVPGSGQLYKALTDWVENKTAPTSLTLTSADGTRSQPVCMHPLKATYNGSGDVKVASSWTCK